MRRVVLIAWLLLGGTLFPHRARPEEPVRVWLHPWPVSSQLGAVSLTFDDAYASQVLVAMPLLEERGFRGTFYVTLDKLRHRGKYYDVPSAPLPLWQEAARRGHEIGSHTVSHVPLDTVDTVRMQKELYVSQFVLEVLFEEGTILSLAYPYSRLNRDVVEVARALYTSGKLGLTFSSGLLYNHPARVDFFRLKSLFLCSGEPASQWNAAVGRTLRAGGWLIETMHPINEEGYCRVRSKNLAAHLDYLRALGRKVWISPVGQVVRRLSHWRRTRVRAVPAGADSILLHLTRVAGDSFSWYAFASVDDPLAWQAVDGRGRKFLVRRQQGHLSVRWPSWADTTMILRRTAAAADRADN